MSKITRIAPTPSGFLHVGNALNAVIVWLWAKRNDASILLRIDDLDKDRIRPEYIDDVFRTLDWLGIDWDLGPQSVSDFESTWSQRHRMGNYHNAISALENNGIVYRCECSRQKWTNEGYDGCACSLHMTEDISQSLLRLKTMPSKYSLKDLWIGDQLVNFDPRSMMSIIRRRDGLPSYQIASVVDDVEYGITHIIRGIDLVESTAFQLHIAEQLGYSSFEAIQFMHHPLVHHDEGKMSKSAGDTSLKHLRESGAKREVFYSWLSRSMGIEPFTNLSELIYSAPEFILPSSQTLSWSKD